MIGEIVPRLLNFLMLPIMTSYLSPEDYGIIGYVDAIILFVFIFSVLSLNSYLLREYFELKTIQDQKRLIGNFFLFLISYNIILFIVSFTALFYLFQIIEVQFDIVPILTIALFCNMIEIFCLFPQIIFRVQEKALSYVYFAASKTLFAVIAVVFFLEYYYEDHGPIAKYYGITLSAAVFATISFLIVRKNAFFSFNIKQLKDGFLFSFPLVLAALSFTVVDMSDRIILEDYVSMREIGIYSIAYALGFGVNVIIRGSYKAFEPIIFKNSKEIDFLNIFSTIKKEYLALVFGACFLIVLFSKEIIVLILPEEYYEAYLLMPIIVLAAFAKGIYTIQVLLLMIKKNTKVISKIMILGAILNVSINLMFIEDYGTIVAAISTLASFSVMSLLVHIKCFEYYKLNYLIEIRDYLFISILGLIVYSLYFNLDIPITFDSISLKIITLIISLMIAFKFYRKSNSNILSNKND